MRAVLDTNVVLRTAVAEIRHGNMHGILRHMSQSNGTATSKPQATFVYCTCPELLDEFEHVLGPLLQTEWFAKKRGREIKTAITRGQMNAWLSKNSDLNAATLQNMGDLTAVAQVVGIMKHRLRCRAQVVDVTNVPSLIPEDPDDNKVLELARQVEATYLVSDDGHLRRWGAYSYVLERLNKYRRALPRRQVADLEERLNKLRPYRGIRIISRVEFTELLKRQDFQLKTQARTQRNCEEVA